MNPSASTPAGGAQPSCVDSAIGSPREFLSCTTCSAALSSATDRSKTHTTIGFELLKGSDSTILQAAATIAVAHHEKFDGSGYPYGLAGEAIPLFGRIVAVADVFDALTSERPYKKAWTVEQAAGLLRDGRGRHFDPACLDAFFAS